jgi:hypothetical protein
MRLVATSPEIAAGFILSNGRNSVRASKCIQLLMRRNTKWTEYRRQQ